MGTMGTTRVKDVMVTALITIQQTDKMQDVAKLFDEQDIHAAPVLDDQGKCVGVLSSHDIMEYESVRRAIESELGSRSAINVAQYGAGINFRFPGLHFGEVGYHMSKQIEPASANAPLSQVAKVMCAKHRHHVLVLNNEGEPIGMLSSLDLLGFITGEPVCRNASCESTVTENGDPPHSLTGFLMDHAAFDE